jgi:hypothetical protein
MVQLRNRTAQLRNRTAQMRNRKPGKFPQWFGNVPVTSGVRRLLYLSAVADDPFAVADGLFAVALAPFAVALASCPFSVAFPLS